MEITDNSQTFKECFYFCDYQRELETMFNNIYVKCLNSFVTILNYKTETLEISTFSFKDTFFYVPETPKDAEFRLTSPHCEDLEITKDPKCAGLFTMIATCDVILAIFNDVSTKILLEKLKNSNATIIAKEPKDFQGEFELFGLYAEMILRSEFGTDRGDDNLTHAKINKIRAELYNLALKMNADLFKKLLTE